MTWRETWWTNWKWITRHGFRNHWGFMTLLGIGRLNDNGVCGRFRFDSRLRLLWLLLLHLRAVFLIMIDYLSVVRHFVGWCKFSCNLAGNGERIAYRISAWVICIRWRNSSSSGLVRYRLILDVWVIIMGIKWCFRLADLQANAVSSYGFTTSELIALALCLSKEIFPMFTWQVFPWHNLRFVCRET